MNRALLAVAAVAAMAASLPAAAQFQKPEDAIKYRQGALNVMAAHVGRLGAMAQGRVPYDAKAAAEHMAVINVVHKLPWTAFPAGSDKGHPNRAKSSIWSDAAGFKAASDKLVAEVAKLDAAVKAGNADALKAAFGPVGASCKGCHDNYRNDAYAQ